MLIIDAMNEYRSGSIDVYVPRSLGSDGNAIANYITKFVEDELAKTNEWPVKIDFRSGYGVPERPDVMRWRVRYTTGAFGHRTW
ncbi:hypothetical protein [Nocardia blacklockiae]|uniref:hypothetical protein n=1 Tax=Nocardia blacklockiae TaxID=480036 RepID=UPI0018962300|nr:hypothetical protein [Nocardia blacklockiae]MBF6174279.1 hypothetical protein [Nocardia blacklockiae]